MEMSYRTVAYGGSLRCMDAQPIATTEYAEAFRAMQQYTLPDQPLPLTEFLLRLASEAAADYRLAGNAVRYDAVRETYNEVAHFFQELVKTKVEYEHGTVDPEILEMARDNLIEAITDFRQQLPESLKAAMPEKWKIMAGIDDMLHQMERPARYHQEHHAASINAMRQEQIGPDKKTPQLERIVAEANLRRKKNDCTELFADAARRSTAHSVLAEFKFTPAKGKWLENLLLALDNTRSMLRDKDSVFHNAEKSLERLQELSTQLERDLNHFTECAATNSGSDRAHLDDSFDSLCETVSAIRAFVPPDKQSLIPDADDFVQHRERLLTRVRNSVATARCSAGYGQSGGMGR